MSDAQSSREPVTGAPAQKEVWRDALLSSKATVQDAIRNLDASGLQITLLVSPDGSLFGTLTDGDIRRGMLRGFDLTSPVEAIGNRDPIVVPPELGREAVLQFMQANKINQLPIVSSDRRVLGLHLRDELLAPAARENLMLILAGGQGSRLRPHTETCPKPLLPVHGRPMLEHIIERAKAEGFRRFVLAVHYLGEMIEDHFSDGKQWGVEISYVREQTPLGTAGAIGLLDPVPDAPFVISNGDVLTDIRYGELLDFHRRHAAAATMAVRLHEWQHPFGVVRISGVDIVGFEEKPIARTHINAGIYVLDPKARSVITPGEHCGMPTLFTRLQERGERTIVYPMHEPWLDVGRASDLEEAQNHRSPNTQI